ncbi:MAG TPA: lysophospholipid acyltransferase family protein [Candidatus Binataceae bacterium]|nr:lysophospholipid acyltransferase family protein [Candidatus Binataceae bacterium]
MPRQIGPVPARIEYTGVAGIVAMLRAMSLERAVRVGARLGTIAAALDRPNRPIAMRNLEIAFPEMDRAARLEIVRGVYRNWGRMLAEWAHMGSLNRTNIERYVKYEGRENWDEGLRLSNGRGAIVLTAHFGNFELMNVAHSIYGNLIAIVHRPLRNPLIDAAVCAARVRFGNRIIERKNGAMETIRLMRKNWHIAVALDLDVRDGVFVDFFGMPACTSEGVARLAMATGAPIVPCFMIRDGASTRHTIAIQPPLELVRGRDRDAAMRENTQRCVAAIEKMIRLHPDHWNWIHRRWKTRPPGEPRFY